MEINGVPLSYQERLLGEALSQRIRSEVASDLAANTTESYSPYADLAIEFEKKNMNLCNLKDKFRKLRNQVLEGKGRCTLRCLPLATILTIIWGFISVRQRENQNFYQIQNILDLIPSNKRIEFNKSFVDLVTQSGQKPYFAQSCAAAPLNSCLNKSHVQDASAIHRNLTHTCHELAKLSLLVDHQGDCRPQRHEILEILQIGRGIRDEVDRFALIQSTQCLKVEAWPNLQAHFLSIDPQTLSPVKSSMPLEQLLQVDLGLSIQDLTELFSIQNGVQGLYQVRDEISSISKIEQAKLSPWGSEMSVAECAPETIPETERVAKNIKTEAVDPMDGVHSEDEIEVIGQFTGTCVQERNKGGDVTRVKKEKFEIFECSEEPEVGSHNFEIPSPEFEPLDTEPRNPRSVPEGSSVSSSLTNSDETPSMMSPSSSTDVAGNSNQDKGKTSERKPVNKNKDASGESTNHALPSYVVRCHSNKGSPGVKFTKLKLQPEWKKRQDRSPFDRRISQVLAGQRNIPSGPVYEGGLMLDEATKTHKLFKTSRQFFEHKKRTGEFGQWGKDGVLMHEVKDPESGFCVFEYVTDPGNPIYGQQTQQGVNYLRVPHELTDPFIQIYNSTIEQKPQERLDFKLNVGNWVRFVDTTLRFVEKPRQPVGCALCTRDLPFTFIFYGIYQLKGHLKTYHNVDADQCIDLSVKLEGGTLPRGGYPVEPKQITKWMGLALKIRNRLRDNIRNPPRPYNPSLPDSGPPWITNDFGDPEFSDFHDRGRETSQRSKNKGKGRKGKSRSREKSSQRTPSADHDVSSSNVPDIRLPEYQVDPNNESPSDILDLHPSEEDWA